MKFMLFEEFHTVLAKEAYKQLLRFYSAQQLINRPYGSRLSKKSSDKEIRNVYYQECKKDPKKISEQLVRYLGEECVYMKDMKFFDYLYENYTIGAGALKHYLTIAAETKNVEFADKMFELFTPGTMREITRKYTPIVPSFGEVDSQSEWIWNRLFDKGIISASAEMDPWKRFDIAYVPTHSIEKFGQDAEVTKFTIKNICELYRRKDFAERVEKFIELPNVWKWLCAHPDDVDTSAGSETFGECMPEEKLREINHMRRGKLASQKFGF
jgi:uncharacterized protein YozE (UPF0346 family)